MDKSVRGEYFENEYKKRKKKTKILFFLEVKNIRDI